MELDATQIRRLAGAARAFAEAADEFEAVCSAAGAGAAGFAAANAAERVLAARYQELLQAILGRDGGV
jgi:hypothetical protein